MGQARAIGIAAITIASLLGGRCVMADDGWTHPAGLIDVATLEEIRHKCETQQWAREEIERLARQAQPWLDQPIERLAELLPKRKMQVYWLLICPQCRERLPFEPFNDETASCPRCGRTYDLSEQSVAAEPGSSYAGTLYEGWGCYYLLEISKIAQKMALLHALGEGEKYGRRAAQILLLFAEHIGKLPVRQVGTPVLWTYAYEGDMTVLMALTTAYELVRETEGLLTAEEHQLIQRDLLKHWADTVLRFSEDSTAQHNNMYRWLTTVALVGCAIEDADYVQWAFGVGPYAPEVRPQHKRLKSLTKENYHEDGAFWGLCSAYHLYALGPHCLAMLLGKRLSHQMPELFPPELYDEMATDNVRGQVARNAIKWFTSQAFPDLTMAPFGDMGGRVSLATYSMTAEIGYRYLGIEEVGSYPSLRDGQRGLIALLYGAETIEERPWEYESAYLTSGYVALKRETADNRLYAGLNALKPGSGHSHADRLNLLTYSRDRMLTGEKTTRYDDPEQRAYSGASYAHNTVTVDETSQPHGDRLSQEQVPTVKTFVDLPTMQVAEAHGDAVYEQTRVFRRVLCQFDDYVVDIFRVEGGQTHDWFYHGVGEEPELSIPMEHRSSFEPALYVTRGEPGYRTGTTDRSFSATWRIPAEPDAELAGRRRDVYSRVTLAEAPGQIVNVLSTWPNPGRYSLMVRHVASDAPFIAVHEAFHDRPVVSEVRALPGTSDASVEVMHADGSRRVVIYGSGSAGDDVALRGALGMLQFAADGRLRAAAMVRGTELRYRGTRVIGGRQEVTTSVELNRERLSVVSSPAVAYTTVGGQRLFRAGADARIYVRLSKGLSPSGEEIAAVVDLPGQDETGPRPVTVRLR